ncbi:Autoinducer 2 sensor kinase/phosphatase LuxQ [compost metagenome]
MNSYIKDINRIKSLLAYAVIDTPSEEFYDTLNSLVSTICNTPISLISFIDDERQWYKSKIGMDVVELPVEDTICQYTLLEEDIMEIPDTLQDGRLVGNPHVQAENGIRFYAGISLRAEDGYAIGSVCAADFKPQHLTDMQKQALRDIAKMIMIHLEAKKRNEEMEGELQNVLQEKIEISERQIQLQEKVYNNLFEAISQSNAIIEFSKEGTILNLNTQFAEMMGYAVEELIGQKHTIFLTETLAESNDLIWQKLLSGKPYAGKFKRKHKDGNTIWMQSSYSPVIDMEGEITKITTISVDITNDVLAINALEELSKQKDHFLANISHELRSPIHAILGFTDLLIEGEGDQKKQKQLQSVKTAGDNLLYLVNGILDLSKIEAGLFQFDLIRFHLADTIENVFSVLGGKAAQKGLRFNYEIAPEIPAFVTGDPHRLTQILINLLDNALKFTSEGGVKLTVSADWKGLNKVALTFVVSDTGIGIPENKLESIFGRFTQAEENTTRKYGGTGLGLNICKLLVEKQGGTISVSSKSGEYTKFTFELLFEVPKEQEQAESRSATVDYSDLRGKILMCEDNEANSMLAQQLFASTGIELDIAKNGREGVELFRQKAYDLVLMDIQMPEMDGYQATGYIRNELSSGIPIIALTAHSVSKEKEKCIAAGMNDYLPKPFKKNELFDKVRQWIRTEREAEREFPADLQITEALIDSGGFAFSLDMIRDASNGNRNFENQMLALFLKESADVLEEIKTCYREQDWKTISKRAHKLKSSFGMFEMDTAILNYLEHEISPDGAKEQIELLEKQVNQSHQRIHSLMNQNG